MGVSRVPGTEGATMGPPADMLYAVEPDGVAMIKPSACNTSLCSRLSSVQQADYQLSVQQASTVCRYLAITNRRYHDS